MMEAEQERHEQRGRPARLGGLFVQRPRQPSSRAASVPRVPLHNRFEALESAGVVSENAMGGQAVEAEAVFFAPPGCPVQEGPRAITVGSFR